LHGVGGIVDQIDEDLLETPEKTATIY